MYTYISYVFKKIKFVKKEQGFRRKVDELDELLSKITEDNLHGEIDSGEPVGREIF